MRCAPLCVTLLSLLDWPVAIWAWRQGTSLMAGLHFSWEPFASQGLACAGLCSHSSDRCLSLMAAPLMAALGRQFYLLFLHAALFFIRTRACQGERSRHQWSLQPTGGLVSLAHSLSCIAELWHCFSERWLRKVAAKRTGFWSWSPSL